MIRVVLDTNVLVAAFKSSEGASFQVLSSVVEDGPFQVSVSVPLVLEYEMALKREIGEHDERIEPILDYLCKVGNRTEIYFLWRPFLRDPGDEMVLEVAVGSQAQMIVTHNTRHFAGVEDRFNVRVSTPGELIRMLREER